MIYDKGHDDTVKLKLKHVDKRTEIELSMQDMAAILSLHVPRAA